MRIALKNFKLLQPESTIIRKTRFIKYWGQQHKERGGNLASRPPRGKPKLMSNTVARMCCKYLQAGYKVGSKFKPWPSVAQVRILTPRRRRRPAPLAPPTRIATISKLKEYFSLPSGMSET